MIGNSLGRVRNYRCKVNYEIETAQLASSLNIEVNETAAGVYILTV